jgi:hypothetical protein
VRGDQNSAFGRNFGTAWYPRVGASYQMHQEIVVPAPRPGEHLRLRTLVGQARPPGTTAALQFSRATPTGPIPPTCRADLPDLGNADLKPENAHGVRGGWLRRRRVAGPAHGPITTTPGSRRRDIIDATLAPSLGSTGATTRRRTSLAAERRVGVPAHPRVRSPSTAWRGHHVSTARATRPRRVAGEPAAGHRRHAAHPSRLPARRFWQRGYTYAAARHRLIDERDHAGDSVGFVGYRAAAHRDLGPERRRRVLVSCA